MRICRFQLELVGYTTYLALLFEIINSTYCTGNSIFKTRDFPGKSYLITT
eukprot:403348841